MQINAYAKINLSLDITGRREDGFHTLDTVMQTVSLCDRITLTPVSEPGVRLRTNLRYLPINEKNTAYRAAKLFFAQCGKEDAGLEIKIEKKVPSRAGLGGGSADAAAVLRGLNELYGARLGPQALLELGAKIGSDVPFCLHGGACRCTGVGELLEPVTPLPECFLVICKPPAGMSTPRAYALLDQSPPSRTQGTPKMIEALESGDLRRIGRALSNRFDDAMRLMQVREIKRVMTSAGAAGALMTGSGSAVFGLFPSSMSAENCAGLLAEKGEVFLAQPVRHAF